MNTTLDHRQQAKPLDPVDMPLAERTTALQGHVDMIASQLINADQFHKLKDEMNNLEALAKANHQAISMSKMEQLNREKMDEGKLAITNSLNGRALVDFLDLVEDVVSTDLSAKSQGICAYCQEIIIGNLLKIREELYHTEHLFCAQCHRTHLSQYCEWNNQITCQECVEKELSTVQKRK